MKSTKKSAIASERRRVWDYDDEILEMYFIFKLGVYMQIVICIPSSGT
jgi:hypothetical protein